MKALRKIIKLSQESQEPIHLIFESHGGDLPSGLFLLDYVENFINNEIVCIGSKHLDSLATLLFVALPGKKYLTEDCQVGVHLLKEYNALRTALNKSVKELFKEHTDLATVDNFQQEQYNFDAQEAFRLKFCDQVIPAL